MGKSHTNICPKNYILLIRSLFIGWNKAERNRHEVMLAQRNQSRTTTPFALALALPPQNN